MTVEMSEMIQCRHTSNRKHRKHT